MLSGGLSNNLRSHIGAGFSSLPLSTNWGTGLGYGGYGGLGLRSAAVPISYAAQPAYPQVLEVTGDDQPVQVIFRSLGARVHVQQIHTPSGPAQVESTRTEDEPHRVQHEILRPVIQEVREVIQPYRRVTQEIRPVLEEVHTVVAKGEGKRGLVGGAGLGLNTLSDGGLHGASYGLASNYKSSKKA